LKKYSPYLLGGLIIVAVIVLLFAQKSGARQQRKMDERVTLHKRDKIAYGTYVAYNLLPKLFPKAAISVSKKQPGDWEQLSIYDEQQALIVVAPRFLADDYELTKLIRFVSSGNDVFVSTLVPGEYVDDHLGIDSRYNYSGLFYKNSSIEDTMSVSLLQPPFASSQLFTYPGKKIDGYFAGLDTLKATVLGRGDNGQPDFIHFKAGKGNFYLHLSPLAFSNYFLLRDKNIRYYENALSVISPRTTKIVWDEYYLNKLHPSQSREDDSDSWFSAIFKYRGLGEALVAAMLLLLLYVLLEMRRKQRSIPKMARPRNDSLDFVKTIGRLYHDKGDHHNLAVKMSSYFLEHIRSRYKLPTTTLDEQFIQRLQFKTGVEEAELTAIINNIKKLEAVARVSNAQLVAFHKQLEAFYTKA